jgi:hypothetical protein
MRTIRKAKNEVVLPQYVVGETVTLHRSMHDGRGQDHCWTEYGVVIKNNKVTVDIRLNTDAAIRLDKRGEPGYRLEKGTQHPVVNEYYTNCR